MGHTEVAAHGNSTAAFPRNGRSERRKLIRATGWSRPGSVVQPLQRIPRTIHFTTSTRSNTAIGRPNQSAYALKVKPHSGSDEPSTSTAIARPSRHDNRRSLLPKISHQKGNDSQTRLASPHTISQSLFLIRQRALQPRAASDRFIVRRNSRYVRLLESLLLDPHAKVSRELKGPF